MFLYMQLCLVKLKRKKYKQKKSMNTYTIIMPIV